MFIGSYTVKKDGVIVSSGAHEYEKEETFLAELPMGARLVAKNIWKKDCGDGWVERFGIFERRERLEDMTPVQANLALTIERYHSR